MCDQQPPTPGLGRVGPSSSCRFLPSVSIPSVGGSSPHPQPGNLSVLGPFLLGSQSCHSPLLPLPSHQPLSVLGPSPVPSAPRFSASPPRPSGRPSGALCPLSSWHTGSPLTLPHPIASEPLHGGRTPKSRAWLCPNVQEENQMWQKLQGLANHHSLLCLPSRPGSCLAAPVIHSPASGPGGSLHPRVQWPAGLQGRDISGEITPTSLPTPCSSGD